jgi:DNA modification methylase
MKNLIKDVSINGVVPHPTVMKSYQTKNLDGLKYTMEKLPLLESLRVVKRGNKYLIIDGISRYKVAVKLKWKKIRVEILDYPDDQIGDQFVIRNFKTKRSLLEICNQAETILGILGTSQGKKRKMIGDLELGDSEFGLAGKDRFQLACTVLGFDLSPSTLRRILAVKSFEENGTREIKGLGLMEKLEKGIMKPNTAFKLMNIYTGEKKEQNTNTLTESLEYIHGKKFKLFNKSCLDLSDLDDESIDTVVTSGPYFQLRQYPNGILPKGVIQFGLEKTPDEFIKKEVTISNGVMRKLKETGSYFKIIGESYEGESCLIIHKLVIAMVNAGWSLQSEWTWKKENPKPQSNIKRLLPATERVLHFVKNKDKFYFKDFKNWNSDGKFEVVKGSNDVGLGMKGDRNSWTLKKPYTRFKDFLDEQKVRGVIETGVFNWEELKGIDPNFRHMAPFPSVIPLLPILMTTKPGDTVLDIFSGTGTTAEVAIQLGRVAVGFDVDPKSNEFAAKRLRKIEENLPNIKDVINFEKEYFKKVG